MKGDYEIERRKKNHDINIRKLKQQHRLRIRRYLSTMIFAFVGASGALWIASLERKLLKKATTKAKWKRTNSEAENKNKWSPKGKKKPPAGKQWQNPQGEKRKQPPGKPMQNLNMDRESANNGIKDTKATTATKHVKKSKNKQTEEVKGKKAKRIWANVTITLIGERNTGAPWVLNELQRCFPNHRVNERLIRHKHWFQANDSHAHTPTVVVAEFRNPYEWIELMRQVPLHAPNHMYLDWKTFVKKPWTIDRPKRDIEFKEAGFTSCYEGFSYNELIPCVEGTREDEDFQDRLKNNTKAGFFSGYKPVYELKADGEPYADILKFRSAKILNFLSVEDWDWVAKLITVQHEALLAYGTDFLIHNLEEALKAKSECLYTRAPQLDRRRRNITIPYVEYVDKKLNWFVEKKIGYNKGDWISDSQIIDPNKKVGSKTKESE